MHRTLNNMWVRFYTCRISCRLKPYLTKCGKIIMKVTNKIQLCELTYFSLSALHVSGDVFAHHQEHLTVFTVSGVSTHPRHQPAATWLNTTRYCKYSLLLLMMGENIARNM